MDEVEIESLKNRYFNLKAQIKQSCLTSKRDEKEITFIAVSKKHSFEKIKILYDCGQRDFGENYVQELLQKITEAQSLGLKDIRWHFIGHLQSNKVKSILPHVHAIHSICTHSTLKELNKNIQSSLHQLFLVECNIDNEETKSGLKVDEIESFIKDADALNIPLSGLMIIPKSGTTDDVKNSFYRCQQLVQKIFKDKKILSMGMSEDFQIAIEMGSHFIRIGTALFGERH